MPAAKISSNEAKRLASLRQYQLLDTLRETEYDDITHIASQICGTPISFITLIDKDRQWIKSSHGIDVNETPREQAFCAHGLLHPDQPLIVNNALTDERFSDNPLTRGEYPFEFYAGVSLIGREGLPLGSLCVIDHQPRKITEAQLDALKALARQVEKLLEFRRTNADLKAAQKQLDLTNHNLQDFAYIIAHDLKAPLRNMRQLSDILMEEYSSNLDQDGLEMLAHIADNAKRGNQLIDGTLNYAQATHVVGNAEAIDIRNFLNDLLIGIKPPPHITLHLEEVSGTVNCFPLVLQHIMQNLLTNAIKYHNKPQGNIWIKTEQLGKFVQFSVQDDGPGIPEKHLQQIFNIFYVIDPKSEQSANSTGIGLSIVKNLVTKEGGTIKAASVPGEGTTFSFTLNTQECD